MRDELEGFITEDDGEEESSSASGSGDSESSSGSDSDESFGNEAAREYVPKRKAGSKSPVRQTPNSELDLSEMNSPSSTPWWEEIVKVCVPTSLCVIVCVYV